jgi:hypothetical protein
MKLYEICPMGAELFHKDGQTDMTKSTVAFHNFPKVHKNSTRCSRAFMRCVWISGQTAANFALNKMNLTVLYK